jgi:hypothetical protein
MRPQLSIITACYNDFVNLASTLTSLRGELDYRDELLLVDSSASHEEARALVKSIRLSCVNRCVWVEPAGVYAAQNKGIVESTGEWIQILNSGDCLCHGARREIDKALNAFPNVNVHVFRGRAVGPNTKSFVFSPTATSVWPHQSIISRRSVYEQEGLYPEKYRLAADQMFFAAIRKSQAWKLHTAVLTEYLLGGLSSGAGCLHLREAYAVRRALGQGLVRSILGGYAMPVIRRSLETVFGTELVNNLKCRLFRHYEQG